MLYFWLSEEKAFGPNNHLQGIGKAILFLKYTLASYSLSMQRITEVGKISRHTKALFLNPT